MRQVWIPRIGRPEVLEVREAPDPEPGKGQIRIAVGAAGVNFADVMARMGLYPDAPPLPAVIGYEVAGTVDAIGPAVDGFKLGDRAIALTRFGGYSDRLVVKASQVIALPAGIDDSRGAALPVNYLTAWLMLIHHGNVRPGDRVLIHSVAGGVGQAALQIARWRGAEVIGTASASKHARLAELGVAHCIDYRTADVVREVRRITDGRGVDLALDSVGGSSFRDSYRCLAPLGRVFLFGVSSFAPGERRNLFAAARGFLVMPSFKPLKLMNDNRGVIGIDLGQLWDQLDRLVPMMKEIVALCAGGVLAPVVDRAVPFDRAPEAHAHLQSRTAFGKIVLTPT